MAKRKENGRDEGEGSKRNKEGDGKVKREKGKGKKRNGGKWES